MIAEIKLKKLQDFALNDLIGFVAFRAAANCLLWICRLAI
jgi:hypothetical protein